MRAIEANPGGGEARGDGGLSESGSTATRRKVRVFGANEANLGESV